MNSWGEFFNSDLGKNLTNIGTKALSNSLKLTSSGKQNQANVQPIQTIVQATPMMSSNNTIYWIAGGGAVLILAIVMIKMR